VNGIEPMIFPLAERDALSVRLCADHRN
jgi:hypothetical protein